MMKNLYNLMSFKVEGYKVWSCVDTTLKGNQEVIGEGQPDAYGRTSLLQALALGLIPAHRAEALLYDEPKMVNSIAKEARILVKLTTKSDASRRVAPHWVETTIQDSEGCLWQKSLPEDFPWDRVFVCGYGERSFSTQQHFSTRFTPGPGAAVGTLFRAHTMLGMGTSYQILKMMALESSKEEKFNELVQGLAHLMGLEYILPLKCRAKAPGGPELSIDAFGPRVQETLGWILDALVRWNHYQGEGFHTKLRGILLVDDIDRGLSKKGVDRVLQYFSEHHPKAQLICTVR